MTKTRNGQFTATLFLETGKRFSFKYLLDNGHWYNDSEADGYETNQWGDSNSVIDTSLPTTFSSPATDKATKPSAPKKPVAPKAPVPEVPAKKAEAPAKKTSTKKEKVVAAKKPVAAKRDKAPAKKSK